MLNKFILISLLSTFIASSAYAKEPSVAHSSAEWQIWAYSTAAPDFIGEFASVKGANGEVLREGSNGCLLYTSPSPRDQRGSRMPSSA